MRSVYFYITICVMTAGILLSTSAVEAGKRVNLDITAASFRKLPIAVPYFEDKKQPGRTSASGRTMADIASRALEFHGFIDIVDPGSYGGKQATEWDTVGADFTILGTYSVSKKGLVLELRVNDVHEGRMLLGRRYKGDWKNRRKFVLKFCDEVVERL
ncbi:MAG: hypothetical protein KAQ71_18075, partial [Desulfobulbaceae bacterium]|nr:hypothetical protein [Desulfobulbaceae bacterium]